MPIPSILKRFAGDTRGNVAIICAVAILPILVIAGGATDIARHEAYRVQLQDGVDRAVLAAASLTQTRTVENTINEYLKSVPFIADVDVQFTRTVTLNSREVTVNATYDMVTGFLPLIGIRSIRVAASGTAKERKSNIEVSMILDISGSMREGNPQKLSLLKPAAKQFIDVMLSPENRDRTSISIVPYAGSVNVGATVFDGLGITRRHNYSSCMEFALTDYASNVGVIPFNQRTQVPHFTQNHQGVNYPGLDWGYCPTEVTAMSFISNDAAALKNKIDTMRMADGTGTAIGMKWGMNLLEPALQPYIALAASGGMVSPQFALRPAPFNSLDTIKVIVLMTDGAISEQRRPKQYDYPRNPEGGAGNNTWYDAGVANNHLQSVCQRAKNNGVVVYTIGFQVNGSGRSQMQSCASSVSQYYDVSGIDIAAAFSSIATSIHKIRLTN